MLSKKRKREEGETDRRRERCRGGREKKRSRVRGGGEGKKERKDETGEGERSSTTRKGGHGRCCRRKKRRWYKREEVGWKSKTARKRGERGLAYGTGGLKEGSRDRDGGTQREGGRCFRHLKPAVGGTDPL